MDFDMMCARARIYTRDEMKTTRWKKNRRITLATAIFAKETTKKKQRTKHMQSEMLTKRSKHIHSFTCGRGFFCRIYFDLAFFFFFAFKADEFYFIKFPTLPVRSNWISSIYNYYDCYCHCFLNAIAIEMNKSALFLVSIVVIFVLLLHRCRHSWFIHFFSVDFCSMFVDAI